MAFDISAMVKELQETIEIKDDPKTLNIDILLKAPNGGEAGDGPSPLPQMQDKAGFMDLMKMAGMEPVQDFEFEQIEGGTRLKCKNKKDKATLKKLMEQLFKGDLLKKVFDQLFAAFNSMGDAMGKAMDEIGKKMGDLDKTMGEPDKDTCQEDKKEE